MAGTTNLYTLVEAHLYTESLGKLGNVERLDEALTGLLWAISRRPDDFPVVSGSKTVRVAKSEYLKVDDAERRKLRIFFRIHDVNCVEMLYIDFLDITGH